jgi:hypothetical protein
VGVAVTEPLLPDSMDMLSLEEFATDNDQENGWVGAAEDTFQAVLTDPSRRLCRIGGVSVAISVVPRPIFLSVWSSTPPSLVRFFVHDEMLEIETDQTDQDVQASSKVLYHQRAFVGRWRPSWFSHYKEDIRNPAGETV